MTVLPSGLVVASLTFRRRLTGAQRGLSAAGAAAAKTPFDSLDSLHEKGVI